MYETVKEVDEETITKKNIMPLTKDNTNSIQYDNVEDRDEINNSQIVEAVLTKNNKKLVNLKMILCIYWMVKNIFCKKSIDIFMNDDNKMYGNVEKFCCWRLNNCKKTK